jgi:hypothetical protein
MRLDSLNYLNYVVELTRSVRTVTFLNYSDSDAVHSGTGKLRAGISTIAVYRRMP